MNFYFNLSVIFTIGSLLLAPAYGYDPTADKPRMADELPKEIEGVGITEKLGDEIDLTLSFTNEKGESVRLGQYFSNKPVILSIVYYACPSLCNYHLNGLNEALKELKWTVGDQFELIAVSMDHRENPELAKTKMQSYIEEYGRPESASGWHFLTGTEENVKKLTDQLGFRFKWNAEAKEYAHASAANILTAGGKISRYLHGIQFDKKDIKLALLEASDGKIGSIVDQVILYCFQFDPKKNKYTLYAYNVMRAGGVFMVLLLAMFLIPFWIREKKTSRRPE